MNTQSNNKDTTKPSSDSKKKIHKMKISKKISNKISNKKISMCKNVPSNITYDEKYQYIVNCLTSPRNYSNIKKAMSRYLYSRGENDGKPIDRRKTLELCSNKHLENMFIENRESFNFTEDIVCCSICGKQINQGDEVEIDHLIPSTFFFVLFAKYYHTCKHPTITKKTKGLQMCDDFFEIHEECGNFVTKIISIVHKGCNQAKGDAMFFEININGNPFLEESSWRLVPNQSVIDEFIERYISKLYPSDNGIYTGVGYMCANDFERHANILTNGITRDDMIAYMTRRLNTFVRHICTSYNGGNMGHIFDNLFLLNTIPLKLINKTTQIDITHYFDEIREKYDLDSILSRGILIYHNTTTKKMSDRLPRNTSFASVHSLFINSNVLNPSFEQVCELIEDNMEKQNVESSGLGFVRRKTKANKTRNKRT